MFVKTIRHTLPAFQSQQANIISEGYATHLAEITEADGGDRVKPTVSGYREKEIVFALILLHSETRMLRCNVVHRVYNLKPPITPLLIG